MGGGGNVWLQKSGLKKGALTVRDGQILTEDLVFQQIDQLAGVGVQGRQSELSLSIVW